VKDINDENYKAGWVDGYCEGQEETIYLAPEQHRQYFHGFTDGMIAYSEEMSAARRQDQREKEVSKIKRWIATLTSPYKVGE
jgi:hypothetical protein